MPLVLFGIFCYTDTGKSPLWVKYEERKNNLMKMIFLVDGDNNIGTGLQGIDLLTAEDTVLVFFGKGQTLANVKKLCAGTKAQVQYLESVKGGKNSLDFQIITELGVLVGRGEADFAYVISQDKGYEAATAPCGSAMPDTFQEVALRPSIRSCLRASFLMRSASREELARALNQEFGEVQGRLAYAHLESLFAAPAPAEETEKKPAARSRRRSAKTAKAGSKAPEAPAAPEDPVSPEISPAEPAVSPEPAAAPAESKPRTRRGGRRRKKAAEAPAT